MKITLRAAIKEDIDFLLQLRKLTMQDYLIADGVPCTDQDNLARIQYNFDDAKVIEVNGKQAGLFKSSYLPERHQWYLFQIQIHPDFQGKGIGSQLVNTLIDKAKSDSKSVGLSVLKSNPAISLYKSLGFRVIEENEHEYELVFDTH